MTKQLIIGLATLSVAGAAILGTGMYAATTSTTSTGTPATAMFQGKGMKHGGGHMMTELTDAEKTSLASMTADQKLAFFEAKRTAAEAKRTTHNTVIDKLLAGTALTAGEEVTRQEIITARAERKVREAEMQAKREQIKAILEKKAAGTALTTDEQKLIDSMPQRGNKGDKRSGGRGMMKNTTSTATTPTAQ